MKTTKRQFERFKKEFNKWISKFGLFDYQVEFFHADLEENSFAKINATPDSCIVSVWFNKNLPLCPKYHSPESSGKHEAIHLLLARLSILTSDEVTERVLIENERIVRILEKLLR